MLVAAQFQADITWIAGKPTAEPATSFDANELESRR
jgi:hypothetical protein